MLSNAADKERDMRKRVLQLITVTLLTVITVNSYGTGGRTGNAGDWRRIMFTAAQREASNWTNTAALNLHVFAQIEEFQSDELVAAFINQPDALKTLAHDIVASRHVYIGDNDEPSDYNTCAWTNDPTATALTDITFKLALCEGGLMQGGQEFANRLLIHESVHHLLRAPEFTDLIVAKFVGSAAEKDHQEEVFCDKVAMAVQKAFEITALENKPHWRDIAVPWFELRENDAQVLGARGFHASVWTGQTGHASTTNQIIVWGGCREGSMTIYACGGDAYYNDGAIYSPEEDSWRLVTQENAPSPRAEAVAIWTGKSSVTEQNKMIVWGGCRTGDGCSHRLNDGGIFDPLLNTWEPIPGSSTIEPRVHHGAVWTGSELIVWGGHPNPNPNSIFLPNPLDDGGIYNSETGWKKIESGMADAPEPRASAVTIWTGATRNSVSAHKMLVWGGCEKEIGDACSQPFNNGALFDPESHEWSPLQTSGITPNGRHNHSSLYVEDQAKLYIFGGLDCSGNVLNDGHILNLETMQWSPMASTSAGRFKHCVVWAGDKMMIFGGKHYNSATRSYELSASVMAFAPSVIPTNRGRWHMFQTAELTPLLTIEHTAIWTGSSLVVWGGQIFDRGFTNVGSQFFPGTAP